MSDREAFEKWAEDKSFVLNIREHYGYVSVREMAWEIWQAAQDHKSVWTCNACGDQIDTGDKAFIVLEAGDD